MFPSTSIQTLPEEVLIHIFSYLSLGEVCNTVSKVCTQWERLHWDRSLYIMPCILEGERITKYLAHSLELKSSFTSPYFDEVHIRKTIKTCLELKYELSNNRVAYKFACTDLIVMLSHLQAVTLGGNTDRLPIKVSDLLKYCVSLEELKVDPVRPPYIENSDLISLCDQLRGTLRVLQVGCGDWTLEVVNAFPKCRHLEDLVIVYGYELSEQCLLAISNMSNLRRLRIEECDATATTWISMFSNNALKDLTSLYLHDCNFNDSTAVAIGSNLKNLIKLFLVPGSELSRFHVCRSGLESIIKGCSKLITLEVQCELSSNEFDEICLLLPEYLPGLKKLVFITSTITITCSWVSELKQKMPDLLVMHRPMSFYRRDG